MHCMECAASRDLLFESSRVNFLALEFLELALSKTWVHLQSSQVHADPYLKDRWGHTALMEAQGCGHPPE